MTDRPETGEGGIERLRRWILAVIVIGLLGTVTELLFLSHFEQPLQFVPLVLIAAAVIVILWHVRGHDLASLNVFRIVMALFVLSGFAGVIAHFVGSAEFQREIDPQIGTWALVQKVMTSEAPPVLAPGMMLQLGLMGLAYVYSDSRYGRKDRP